MEGKGAGRNRNGDNLRLVYFSGGNHHCQRLHFHVKMYPTFLAAGHCPDLLGELTLQSPSSNRPFTNSKKEKCSRLIFSFII